VQHCQTNPEVLWHKLLPLNARQLLPSYPFAIGQNFGHGVTFPLHPYRHTVASLSWTRRIVETIALAPLYALVPDSANERDGEPGDRERGRRRMTRGRARFHLYVRNYFPEAGAATLALVGRSSISHVPLTV
jgi:hypothetical protein